MAIKVDGTNSKVIFLAGTANATTLTSALTATPWTMTLPPTAGTAGQVLTTDGSGNLSWSAGGGGSPAGLNTEVQFNNGGSFGADPNFTFVSFGPTVGGTLVLGNSTGTTGAVAIFNSSGFNTGIISSSLTTATWTLTLPPDPGTSGQVLITDGFGVTSWSTVASGATTVVDDTTTNATRYPLYSSVTTGSLINAYVASTEYTFNPSTGVLTAPRMESSAGIHLNSNVIAASYTLPAGMNGLSAGPMTVPGGVVVTAPAGQAWVVA